MPRPPRPRPSRLRPAAVALAAGLGALAAGPGAPRGAAADEPASRPAPGVAAAFDLQGHRGARGLAPENTLPAFERALALGVTTLELDVGLSRDGVPIVAHERVVAPLVCRDTAPATPRDRAFPYVGKPIRRLTLRQLRSLDCGTRRPETPALDPFVGTQAAAPGAAMPTLDEVLALGARPGAGAVRFNIELKLDPTRPRETASPAAMTRAVARVVARRRLEGRVTVQSFDWRVLRLAARLLPGARRSALIDEETAELGRPGASPWLDGLDVDAAPARGDLAAAAAASGAHVLSPRHTLVTAALVESAHRHGLAIIPWTVNAPERMAALLDLGVDGIITDYPDRLRQVMAARGMPLPAPAPAAPSPRGTSAGE